MILVGGRLVPGRKGAGSESFEIDAYLTEVRVSDKSKVVGMRLRELESQLLETEARIIGIARGEDRILAPNAFRKIRSGDILLIQAEPVGLASALSSLNLTLEGSVREVADEELANENSTASEITSLDKNNSENPTDDTDSASKMPIQSKEIVLMEFVVMPSSELVGRSARNYRLRAHYGINLLAISRQGQRSLSRLRTTIMKTGDVLLVQGSPDNMTEFGAQFGCVPLAERQLLIPDKRKALLATGIMVAAICGASFGFVSTAIAFATAVLLSVVLDVVPLRSIYKVIDWPVIVLLGAMIPVAGVLDTTGAGDLIARLLLDKVAGGHPLAALTLILIVSMTLSDFMNNAATAAVMCPIAFGTAERLGANPDAFLMAVAVGASCAFLTPIGHQNNTLILGPGGLKFGDYWRLGLPLEVIVVVVAVPMIAIVWPLFS